MSKALQQNPSQKKKVRCYIYTRVSTEEQDRENFSSLEAQEHSCKAFIEARKNEGWEYIRTHHDIATGANINRPGLQAILQDVRDDKLDMIVTYKIDRLSRSIADFYDMWREFEKLGVELSCSTQNIDTSDGTGRLMLNILLSFAQFEREVNSQRVRDKRQQALAQGYWQGGLVPFGYESKHSKKHDRTMLIPHKKEAEAIKLIFHHFLETESQAFVKEEINKKGYRTKTRSFEKKTGGKQLSGGKRFDVDAITRILKNRIYFGELWDERTQTVYDAKHEPIIHDKAIWFRAQEILKRKSAKQIEAKKKGKAQYKKDKHTFLLKGLPYCSVCGSMMTPTFAGKIDKNGEPYLYYTCTQVAELGKRSECTIRNLRARSLEKVVIEATQNLAKHPNLLEDVVKYSSTAAQKKLKPFRKELSVLKKREGAIKTEMDQLIKIAKSKKALSSRAQENAEELEKEYQQVRASELLLQQKIEDLDGEKLNIEMVKDAFKQFDKVIEKLSLEEQKLYCQLLIERIDIYPWDPTKKPSKKSSKKGLLNPEVILENPKTRTPWYVVKIRYREIPEKTTPPTISGGGAGGSGFHPSGSPSCTQI